MNFNKAEFEYFGGYLHYTGDCGIYNEYYRQPCHPTREGLRKEQFVARFKYDKRSKPSFLNFLVKNFTVEEYFNRLITLNQSPVEIMESKGYISPRAKKMCKDAGLPQTLEGYNKLFEDEA